MRTLLYILLVIVLLGVIWCFAYPRLFRERMKAQRTEIHMCVLAAAASEAFKSQHVWPASVQDLIAHPDIGGNMAGFLKSGTNDLWGNPYLLEAFDPVRGYGRIISYGRDGLPGGKGSAKDIVLHYGENQSMKFVKGD